MYIYNMPYSILRDLCRVLDVGNQIWKDLAGEIGYTASQTQFLELEYRRFDGSPSERLLSKWGHSNATVDMLATSLKKINAIRALNIIKHLVSASLREALYEEDDDGENKKVIKLTAVPLYDDGDDMNGGSHVTDDVLPPPAVHKALQADNELQRNNYNNGKNNNNNYNYNYCKGDGNNNKCSTANGGRVFNTLQRATDGFSDKYMISANCDGRIFEGCLNNSRVAIKLYSKIECSKLSEAFVSELEFMKKFKHENVLMYKEVVIDGPVLTIVQPFMENGSLRDRLDCKSNTLPLTWLQRHKILLEVSNGLYHIHSLAPNAIVHGNLKSTNILLGVNMQAKLSDFKLPNDSTTTNTVSNILENSPQCTNFSLNVSENSKFTALKAYMPDEFFTNGFQTNIKSDVFSFGVKEFVHDIFEKKNNKLLCLKDSNVSDWSDDSWIKLMSLGKMCTMNRNDRPSTKVVNNSLKLYQDGALNCIAVIEKGSVDKEPTKDIDLFTTTAPLTNSTEDINSYLSNMKTAKITKPPPPPTLSTTATIFDVNNNTNNTTDIYSSNCNDSQLMRKPTYTKKFDSDIWPIISSSAEFSNKTDNYYCPSDDMKRLQNKKLLDLDFLNSDDDIVSVLKNVALNDDDCVIEMCEKEVSFNLKSSELGSDVEKGSLNVKNHENVTDQKAEKVAKTLDTSSLEKMLASGSSDFFQLSKILATDDEQRFFRLKKLKETFYKS
ncbi:hypothetical protein HELRODRAFT_181411 [Helobdella robusta]|uniref:Protein kinase domain-containing protein n=1 Tax=Helobdella robusta TaxID=6412 RepID=T1FGZ2_HELRO|nr:hypothetical protein HELRODRAFT_181411 [Helobdella robusta]ESN92535.1 hypothetical protein HELRODRAFT_181411 [Helobdella robusta]